MTLWRCRSKLFELPFFGFFNLAFLQGLTVVWLKNIQGDSSTLRGVPDASTTNVHGEMLHALCDIVSRVVFCSNFLMIFPCFAVSKWLCRVLENTRKITPRSLQSTTSGFFFYVKDQFVISYNKKR